MDAGALQATITLAQTQVAIAAKIAKMNIGAEKEVANIIEQAAANLESVVSAPPPGAGTALDISV